MHSRDLLLRRFVTFALHRQHVDKNGTMQVFDVLKDLDELDHIVSVERTEISKSERFKQHSRRHDCFDAALDLVRHCSQTVAEGVEFACQVPDVCFELVVRRMGQDFVEVTVERPQGWFFGRE